MKIIKKIMLAIMCIAATIVMVSCKSKEIEAQKEKSNLQKDKSAIAEIYYLISHVDYMNEFKVNPNGVRINEEGYINILDLLADDVSGEIIERLKEYWGDDFSYNFNSETFKYSTIRYINVDGGIMEINSEKLDYYIDGKGEHEGLYYTEEKEDSVDETTGSVEPVEGN